MVTGAVGSGKSFLLACMMGEIYSKKTGSDDKPTAAPVFVTPESKIALVSQSAWILNMTLQDNILFGRPYNQEKYEKTIKACALQLDLDMLPEGDKTEIGERGINLSGGQKQRVSIARAVYGHDESDVFMFDDPFSALDSHVSEHIFNEVVLGILKGNLSFVFSLVFGCLMTVLASVSKLLCMCAEKTRVIVTHRVIHTRVLHHEFLTFFDIF